MIHLSNIVEEIENGQFFDWSRDFEFFKSTINRTTENSKNRFEKSLSSKILNKSVVVRSSKGYNQPKKDYNIQRVTAVNLNDFYSDWVVVIKDQNNKEYFLTPGYKIKVLGAAVAPEPGTANSPTGPNPNEGEPKVPQQPVKPQPGQPVPQPTQK